MGSCAAPSAKGDDKFITTDYLQQCPEKSVKNTHESFSFRKHVKATWGSGWLHHYFSKRVDMLRIQE
ncbi:hypothetical protein [Enterobacter hormaechei]|uniref:hypothetical protein n=1 Tax=Enterobacter hormaechei TaxID=158836 RepID=UPI0007C77C88|nr:hypothetical protein [Enterobacter hormaechei]